MKIRDGFVSNSSSTSFVLRVKGAVGKEQLLDIFKDSSFASWGDETYIEMCGVQDVIDKIREALYEIKTYGPNIFIRRCIDFARAEKKYGEDIAIVRISHYDDKEDDILGSNYLSILSREGC